MTVIPDRADYARLHVVESGVIGEPADVQFSVVRIAATDEHSVLPVAPPIRERHQLVVQQEVRDRPGYSALKRGLCGRALISAVALRK
jgi:hypothetical protein